MSILDRVGLKQKGGRRPRRLKPEAQGPRSRKKLSRRAIWERSGLLIVLVALGLMAFPRAQFYTTTAESGDIWLDEDLVAPFSFPIHLSEEEIEAQRDSVRRTEPPVFSVNLNAAEETQSLLDSLDAHLEGVFQAYADWKLAETRGQEEDGIPGDSTRYLGLRASFPLAISDTQWDALLASYAAHSGVLPTPTRAGEGSPALDDMLLRSISQLSTGQFANNVLNVVRDSVRTAHVVVRNADPRVRDESIRRMDDLLGIDEAFSLAQSTLTRQYKGHRDTVRMGMAFFEYVFRAPLHYEREATDQRLAEEMRNIRTTRGRIREDMTIIRRGDEVTQEIHEQLVSLEREQRLRAGDISTYRTWLGKFLLILAAYAVFFLYLYLLRPLVFANTRSMLLISLLVGGTVVGFAVLGQIDLLNELAAPVALVSIMLTILFDSRVGMFATVTLAIIGGLVFGFDFQFTFVTIFAGFVGVFSVRDVKNRSHLVISAGLVLGAYVLMGFAYAMVRADPLEARIFLDLRSVLVNAVMLLLASPLLFGIERVFGVTTNIALLELSDTNRDLLKQLSLRAPGTFNHSLQVANLAEAAADVIGANALQARVGALYHDIGKMNKPEYFIENQQPGDNPHDRVKPSMSAIIIGSHVKEGVEIGKQYKLPRVVLDFISTHHGTGLMEYFYRKEEENRAADEQPVDEAEFRYPGPLPATSEQAIVMLADSVEAASRSLQKPTPKRLETLIDTIMKARAEDGQLADSSLTFADLSRIKETFLSILSGVYHFRVKYPDQEEEPGGEPVDADDDGPLALTPTPGLDVEMPTQRAKQTGPLPGQANHDDGPESPSSSEQSSMG